MRTDRVVEPWLIRIAGNETTVRDINEAIEEGRVTADRPIGFLCECGALGCGVILELSLTEYEDVRSEALQFVVAPDHESPADTVVIAVDGRCTVVAKRGEAAARAVETYPRAEGPVVRLIWGHGGRRSLISMDLDPTPDSVPLIRGWLDGFVAEHGANDDDLEVVVADDGRGFRASSPTGLGVGLQLIARTADKFSIRERTPRGTEVRMRFALPTPGRKRCTGSRSTATRSSARSWRARRCCSKKSRAAVRRRTSLGAPGTRRWPSRRAQLWSSLRTP